MLRKKKKTMVLINCTSDLNFLGISFHNQLIGYTQTVPKPLKILYHVIFSDYMSDTLLQNTESYDKTQSNMTYQFFQR